MTQEEVRTLKVGDLVTWKDPDTGATTLEVVVENGCSPKIIHVQLRTIAVIKNVDVDDGIVEYNVGDEGFIHNHNCVNVEKIA